MADLKSILGTRVNVAVSIFEMWNGMKLRVGGFYVVDTGKIIPLDGGTYNWSDTYSEFHWSANNLELIK